ncbi:MAG TPA: MarR family winged helix-turn-helix transcriptional regulator [Longimicrobium sp.]|jgi:DNA-binding MarR family transcriptional regulator|uniref:MarR family winged helix-turn-helix transcriptional regulator n=1 Tax=Longimicrobium sp. TaxID=2029185 RepID=UPI002ED9AE86
MSEPFQPAFSTPGESPGFLLWQVANTWQRLQRDALADLQLTHVQFVLLASVVWLYDREGPLTQARVAAHARTDVMMTSQVLRTLETRGLVVREPHPTDTRARALRPTAPGKELAGRAVVRVEEADARMFAVLGPDVPALASLLRRLAG